jgi:hypothetical protein
MQNTCGAEWVIFGRFRLKNAYSAAQVLGGFALESRVLFITHPLSACATVTGRVMIAFRDVDVEVRCEGTLREFTVEIVSSRAR